MRIHILGICGTFMGSLAVLAKQLGYQVSGQDAHVYPPMSTQLEKLGIDLIQGFAPEAIPVDCDQIVIGNVMCRGMPIIEHLLNHKVPLICGPQFLAQEVLSSRRVIAVSGTHGKTTTASLLAWILSYVGLNPGFLIGGVARNFDYSATLGEENWFVVEADEYDSAFFDKRSKFVHYYPEILIINNIEFDHADIFKNLDAIKTQFHHLVRTVPENGRIIYLQGDANIQSVLEQGCWTPREDFGIDSGTWNFNNLSYPDWELYGEHNLHNALAAIGAAHHVGVSTDLAIEALRHFKGVKRRLEKKFSCQGICVYDDFAHHPTAIKTTIQGLRNQTCAKNRIIAIVDIASNTMKAGIHENILSEAICGADRVYLFVRDAVIWDVKAVWLAARKPGGVFNDFEQLIEHLLPVLSTGDQILCMSNGNFTPFFTLLEQQLAAVKEI